MYLLEKKSEYNWTHTVQTPVIQRPTVFILPGNEIKLIKSTILQLLNFLNISKYS